MAAWSRRSFQNVYFWTICLLGTVVLVSYLPDWSRESEVLATLVILFALAEYFPTRVKVGAISFSFPMAFAAFLLYGIPGMAWVSALGTAVANIARGRSWRVTLFNATQFALAALGTGELSRWLVGPPSLDSWLLPLLTSTALYYVLNNLIVDLILWLRLKHYHRADWLAKNQYEALSAVAGFSYAAMMMLLAPQQRGHDPLALIFFFLPLLTVGAFVRLLTYLSRFAKQMKTLVDVSTLATFAPESQALNTALAHLDSFDEYRYAAIYQTDGDDLTLRAIRGLKRHEVRHDRIPVGEGITGWAAREGTKYVTGDARQDPRNAIGEGQQEQAVTVAAIPLLSGSQVIGVLTVGKERAHALQPEDIRVLTIFANLVAAILQNLALAEERERLLLVQERARLSREIHDGLAQSLAGALLQMDRLERTVENEPRTARRLVHHLREHVRELLLEVRRSIYNLRPSSLEEHGLVEALRHEITRLQAKDLYERTEIRLEVRGEQRRLSGLVEDEVFRIAQEGMTNALKHAAATEVIVGLHFFADRLRLTVRDNGQGFHLADAVRSARERQSFGLTGMSERADRLGANFDIDSRSGQGTRLMLEVPLLGE